MKKIKDNSLYFHQKDILRPLGCVMLPGGVVVVYFAWSFILYIVGGLAAFVGLVFFIVGSAHYISDNDMTELLDHALLDYDRPVTDMVGYEHAVLKQPAPVEIKAYSFGADASYFKKGKNGTPVSDRFTATHIFFTRDSVMLISRSVSISALNEATGAGISDRFEDIPFTALRRVTLEEHVDTVILTNTKKPVNIKWCELIIEGETGEILRIPTKPDMDAATLCEDLNRRIGK